MTYLESAKGVMITRHRAREEFRKHGFTFEEFLEFTMDAIAWPDTTLDEEGDITALNAHKTLQWMGY